MCHYITATLPHAVDLKAVGAVFESHKLGFELISNPNVAAQIDSKDWYVLTTRKQCHCGTPLGSLAHQRTSKDASYERELKRFRKQGWSEAKIKRWLDEKKQSNERHQREDEARAKGTDPELERWIKFLNDLLSTRTAPKLGLLLHFYHTSYDTERVKIQRKETVRLSDVNPERLMRIEEDVLYEFVP